MSTFKIPMTDKPCPRCIAVMDEHSLDEEMIMPLPAAGFAPRARDGSGPCCFDCASADGLMTVGCMTFAMARLAVGNDRADSYRLNGIAMGLVLAGRMHAPPDTLEEHLVWIDRVVNGNEFLATDT